EIARDECDYARFSSLQRPSVGQLDRCMTIRVEELCIHPFMNHGNTVLNRTRIKAFLPVRGAETAVDCLKSNQLRHVAQPQTLASFNVRLVARCETDISAIGAVEELAIAESRD